MYAAHAFGLSIARRVSVVVEGKSSDFYFFKCYIYFILTQVHIFGHWKILLVVDSLEELLLMTTCVLS